ncbi:MAG: LacI family DNA-binding transcriptional regulator, partial [Ruthenibacterium sp.]
NVSKATVSRVINNKVDGVGKETRARVQQMIDNYGYKPNLLARGMATSRTKTIGLVIPDITNPFFPELVKAIEAYSSARGYTVILCNTDSSIEKEQRSISTLIASRVDGVILTTTQDERNHRNTELDKYKIPCVLIDRRLKSNDYSAGVFVDNEYAFYIACEMLVKHSNSRIAFLKGPDNLSTTSERLEGYKSALKQYGLPYETALVAEGDFSFEGGYAAVCRLLENNVSFSAVLASNDTMAIGALKALHEKGLRIPEDVELVGFDNIAMSTMVDPPLTTMEQPIYELGSKATEVLIALMEGRELSEQNIRLEAKMVRRKSTREI